jgi:hypothetical protein
MFEYVCKEVKLWLERGFMKEIKPYNKKAPKEGAFLFA